jgi:hypothetical protein
LDVFRRGCAQGNAQRLSILNLTFQVCGIHIVNVTGKHSQAGVTITIIEFAMARARKKNLKKDAAPQDAHLGDPEYWRSRTPLERMAALEALRQRTYGYTCETRPAFVRVMSIRNMRED